MTYRPPCPPDFRPPLAFGGHDFVYLDGGSVPLLRCVHCYGVLAAHELAEGFMAARVGAWCPGRLTALL